MDWNAGHTSRLFVWVWHVQFFGEQWKEAYLFGFGMYFSIGIRGVKAVFLKYYQIGARGEVGKIGLIFG